MWDKKAKGNVNLKSCQQITKWRHIQLFKLFPHFNKWLHLDLIQTYSELMPYISYIYIYIYIIYIYTCANAQSFKLCLTLREPMDCSLPGSSVHGILQPRILQWVPISSSRGSSSSKVRTHVSYISFLNYRCIHLDIWLIAKSVPQRLGINLDNPGKISHDIYNLNEESYKGKLEIELKLW